MLKRDHIFALLEKRDPRLFMEGGCHVLAEVLKKKFGYPCFAIRRGKVLPHVYCHGTNFAVDGKGRRHEDHVLDEFVHFEGPMGFSRELALRFKLPFEFKDALNEERGLITEPEFLKSAFAFAEDHVTNHESDYKDA